MPIFLVGRIHLSCALCIFSSVLNRRICVSRSNTFLSPSQASCGSVDLSSRIIQTEAGCMMCFLCHSDCQLCLLSCPGVMTAAVLRNGCDLRVEDRLPFDSVLFLFIKVDVLQMNPHPYCIIPSFLRCFNLFRHRRGTCDYL